MVALNKTYRKTLTPDRSAKDSGHRFYSPEISCFISREPLSEAGFATQQGELHLMVQPDAFRGVLSCAFPRNDPIGDVDVLGLLSYIACSDWLPTQDHLEWQGSTEESMVLDARCTCTAIRKCNKFKGHYEGEWVVHGGGWGWREKNGVRYVCMKFEPSVTCKYQWITDETIGLPDVKEDIGIWLQGVDNLNRTQQTVRNESRDFCKTWFPAGEDNLSTPRPGPENQASISGCDPATKPAVPEIGPMPECCEGLPLEVY